MMPVPPITELFNPIMSALRALGNSAALSELEEGTALLSGLPADVLAEPHVRHRGTAREVVTTSTEFSYRSRWALTYLKNAGLVTNSVRGVWAFTELGSQTQQVDPRDVIARARATFLVSRAEQSVPTSPESEYTLAAEQEVSWTDALLNVLIDLAPAAFERLTQRLLREAGFAEVHVTGRSGDGGIDGRGILRLNDLVSLNAICKRYRNNVGAPDIREFRGALAGRADRGILLTTAGFTPAAIQEATRDGVTPIDLIDGERLMELLKQFRLGVRVELVESVTIDADWFAAI